MASLLADGEPTSGFNSSANSSDSLESGFLGVLPPYCAIDTVSTGAVSTAAAEHAHAAAVLSFLAAPETAPIKAAHSFAAA